MRREKEARRYIIGFVCAFLFFAILRNGTYFIEAKHDEPYYFYMISQVGSVLLMSCWMLTIQRRIIEPRIRKLMLRTGGLFLLYFFMQMSKYCLFTEDMKVGRYMWYGYYVPMTLIPLFALYILRYLSVPEGQPLGTGWKHLMIPAALICLGFLTNDLHQQAFGIPNWDISGDKERTLGPIYFIYIAFMAVILVLGIITVVRISRNAVAKKKLLLTAIPLLIGLTYIAIYSIKPSLVRVNINNKHGFFEIPEMFAFMIVGLLEVCIQIGMIPSNLGYARLFTLTGIPARIADMEDQTVYVTKGAEDGFTESEDFRIVRTDVSGGHFDYVMDLSRLNRLNRELDEATTMLEARNEILRHEHEIVETREKTNIAISIYDHISEIVHPKLLEIQELLQNEADEEQFRKNLIRSSILNAYVKRRSNMELEAKNKQGILPFKELITAVTESLEYVKLKGMETFLSTSGDGNCSARQICVAYEVFEQEIEALLYRAEYMTVRLLLTDVIEIRLQYYAEAGDAERVIRIKEGGDVEC